MPSHPIPLSEKFKCEKCGSLIPNKFAEIHNKSKMCLIRRNRAKWYYDTHHFTMTKLLPGVNYLTSPTPS